MIQFFVTTTILLGFIVMLVLIFLDVMGDILEDMQRKMKSFDRFQSHCHNDECKEHKENSDVSNTNGTKSK
jgi:hypothetical protein